jgi:hypothetical protein
VGGTLTKIVFFEKNISEKSKVDSSSNGSSIRSSASDGGFLAVDDFDTPEYARQRSGVSPVIDFTLGGEDGDLDGGVENPLGNLGLKRSKSLSQLDGEEHRAALRKLYEFMNESEKYGETGTRDERLSVYSNTLGGRLEKFK